MVVEFLALKEEKIYEPIKTILIILLEKILTASFFEIGLMPTPLVIGTLRLATMATLQLTKMCSSETIFFSANPGSKTKHLLQISIHGNSAKWDLCKIMGKMRYHYFQN